MEYVVIPDFTRQREQRKGPFTVTQIAVLVVGLLPTVLAFRSNPVIGVIWGTALAALLWALRPTEGGFLISIWIERLRVTVQPRRLDNFRPFANLGAPAARAVPLVWKTRRGEVGLSLSVQSAHQQEK